MEKIVPYLEKAFAGTVSRLHLLHAAVYDQINSISEYFKDNKDDKINFYLALLIPHLCLLLTILLLICGSTDRRGYMIFILMFEFFLTCLIHYSEHRYNRINQA